MKLLIVIPAYNEEESIAATVERTLAAKQHLLAKTDVSEVEVTVVSDGSTDRTVERCEAFVDQIRVIAFEHNRGYGAAIKHAWEQSDADLMGFMDADGTCDPSFFVDLYSALDRTGADIALGSRLHGSSQMPVLRRVGNAFFATLVSTMASTRVRDAASGMRLVRATSLVKILPLPDGLHFTPAMSARAALSDDLQVVEIDMPYRERVGKSKLRVLRDGLRFTRVILETVLLYRPAMPLAVGGTVLLAAAAALLFSPVTYYIGHGAILEWMIYRLVVAELLTLAGVLLIAGGYVANRVSKMTLATGRNTLEDRIGRAILRSRWFWLVPAVLAGTGVALVFPSLIELVRTGATFEHWSRFIGMSTLIGTAIVLSIVRVLDYVLDLLEARLHYLRNQAEESSVRGAPRRTAHR